MSYFAVIRDVGPAWSDGTGALRLTHGALTGRIFTTTVEPWNLFVGADQMATTR